MGYLRKSIIAVQQLLREHNEKNVKENPEAIKVSAEGGNLGVPCEEQKFSEAKERAMRGAGYHPAAH